MFIFLLNPFDIWDFESNFILVLRLKVVLTKKYVILFCSLWFYFCVHPAIYWSDIVNKFRKGEVLKKDKGVGHIGGKCPRKAVECKTDKKCKSSEIEYFHDQSTQNGKV